MCPPQKDRADFAALPAPEGIHPLKKHREVETRSAKPAVSRPQAWDIWAKTKAVYRFWDNPRVTLIGTLDSHIGSTMEHMMKQACVLLIQHTTNLGFAHYPSAKGLGHLHNLRASLLSLRHGSLYPEPTGP